MKEILFKTSYYNLNGFGAAALLEFMNGGVKLFELNVHTFASSLCLKEVLEAIGKSGSLGERILFVGMDVDTHYTVKTTISEAEGQIYFKDAKLEDEGKTTEFSDFAASRRKFEEQSIAFVAKHIFFINSVTLFLENSPLHAEKVNSDLLEDYAFKTKSLAEETTSFIKSKKPQWLDLIKWWQGDPTIIEIKEEPGTGEFIPTAKQVTLPASFGV